MDFDIFVDRPGRQLLAMGSWNDSLVDMHTVRHVHGERHLLLSLLDAAKQCRREACEEEKAAEGDEHDDDDGVVRARWRRHQWWRADGCRRRL